MLYAYNMRPKKFTFDIKQNLQKISTWYFQVSVTSLQGFENVPMGTLR